MRKDMSKVIVERPRSGRAAAGMRPGRTQALADDDGEPIRARGAREPKRPAVKTKQLNETLNPLKRFLAANIGRPWNKVYSEISENLRPSSTVQQHVRDHLDDFVASRTRMKDGKVLAALRFAGERAVEDSHYLYYVHPRTGLLRANDRRQTWKRQQRLAQQREEAERAGRMRLVDDKTQLHLLNGDWWEVKLARIPRKQGRDASGRFYAVELAYVDVVRRAGLSHLPPHTLYGRKGVYACAKRQLSKAELNRAKLR